MTAPGFRFGISLDATGGRSAWQDAARQAEALGYDVILVPDHLHLGSPLPALVSAAAVTSRIRFGTIVLNAGFYRPALLARDAAAVHRFTDGRFELGLGAGSVAEEFVAAELPFPAAPQRVDHLEHTVTVLRRMLAEAGHRVPVLIGGSGSRVLGLAARYADTVHIAGAGGVSRPGQPDPLRRRVDGIRAAAGDRFATLELGLHLPVVHLDGHGDPDLTMVRRFNPGLADTELLALPGVLRGSATRLAEQLHRLHEHYGITYFTTSHGGDNQQSLAAVFDHLPGRGR